MAEQGVTVESTQEELLAARCHDCAFYMAFDTGTDSDGKTGLCRRYPPRDIRKGLPGWPPVTAATDWCGMFWKRSGVP